MADGTSFEKRAELPRSHCGQVIGRGVWGGGWELSECSWETDRLGRGEDRELVCWDEELCEGRLGSGCMSSDGTTWRKSFAGSGEEKVLAGSGWGPGAVDQRA